MTGERSRIRKNSFFSFLSSAIRLGANMLLFVGIARFYGPEAFGQFTTAHTYLTIFYLLADFGFDVFLTTEIARDRSRIAEIFGKVFPLKFVFSLGALFLMCLIGFYSPVSPTTKVLMFVFSVGIIGNALSSSIFSLFKGLENFQHETWTSFIQNLILICGLLILGYLHAPIVYLAMFFVLTRIFGFIVIWQIAIRKIGARSFGLSHHNFGSVLRYSWPYGIHLLFGSLYFQLDTILLSYMRGDQTVGNYQAVMKLIVFVFLLTDIINNALLPVLSRYHVSDRIRWVASGKFLAKTFLYISLPFGVIFLLYPGQILSLIYGSENYAMAASVLRIFAMVLVLRFGAETFALLLTTSGNQFSRMVIAIVATVINFGINLYAIPKYGMMGAAVTSLVTNSFTAISYLVAVKRHSFDATILTDSRILITISIVAAFSFALWRFQSDSFIVGLILIIGVLPMTMFFLGYDKNERKQVLALSKIGW
ncbi:MAG: flippase [Bacteroidota bacterium]